MKRSATLAFERLSTGTKMLLILSAAMLPLGFTALLTSLDMARSAAVERNAAAETATALHAGEIEALVAAGLNAARAPAVSTQDPRYLCSEIGRQALLNRSGRPPVAIFDEQGAKICQSHGPPIDRLAPAGPNVDHVWLDAQRRLLRFTAMRVDGSVRVEADVAIDPVHFRQRQHDGMPLSRLTLRQGQSEVVLVDMGRDGGGERLRISQPLADGRLAMIAEYKAAPARARTALLIVLPILMWAAAAFTCWLIVNRLLLQPLGQVKQAIDTWQATREPLNLPRLTTPSHEIRDLADSFASVAGRIYEHERDLEEGLARQTRLTREVHHRVKNNLQVVSSLINLHSRGSEGAVADAYGAIQRRVDALAVVHRNHYAELEENRGVSMRALAGELATSLRASAPVQAAGMPIALNMIDAYVTQDVAVPVAFLITEVVELLMYSNPKGSVLISLEAGEGPGRATLRIETVGMADRALDDFPGSLRFNRVVTGLARQFRAPLTQDLEAGSFEIQISILP